MVLDHNQYSTVAWNSINRFSPPCKVKICEISLMKLLCEDNVHAVFLDVYWIIYWYTYSFVNLACFVCGWIQHCQYLCTGIKKRDSPYVYGDYGSCATSVPNKGRQVYMLIHRKFYGSCLTHFLPWTKSRLSCQIVWSPLYLMGKGTTIIRWGYRNYD